MTPLLPCDEDSTSIQRHCQLLKNEMKIITPSNSIISKLMEKFHTRRQEILQGEEQYCKRETHLKSCVVYDNIDGNNRSKIMDALDFPLFNLAKMG